MQDTKSTFGLLSHTLQTRHISMISIGSVIGAGFFIGSSSAIAAVGPGVLMTYALAGLIVLLVNIMLRDIARHNPGLGSFITQIRVALGSQTGFVAGWTYLLIWIITLAIEVVGSSTILSRYIPIPYPALECLILGIMTALNIVSVRGYGEFEFWFALIKVAAIIAFITLGLYALITTEHSSVHSAFADGLFPNGPLAALSVLPVVLFSMGGSEVATLAALESPDPDRNIARVTRTVALRIVGFYLTSIALLLVLVPWNKVIPGTSPFVLALTQMHIPFASSIMTFVILTAMLSTLNSGLYASSRVLFEMTDNGDAPFLFRHVSPRTRTPQRAVLACAAATLIIAATAIASPTVVFAFLISITGTFILSNNVLIILARLKLYRTRPWSAWLALTLLLGVLVSMLMRVETRHEILLSLFVLFVVLMAGRLSAGKRHPRTDFPGK